jgi:hypothetical protein
MLPRPLATESNPVAQIVAALTEANLDYLRHCVGFWLAIKPACGVKEWLEYSIRRSTHRLAADGLQETIARLSDDELIGLYRRSAALDVNTTEKSRTLAESGQKPCASRESLQS